MPIWTQHLLIALAVLGCIAFLARSAFRALQGKKSSLAGCGSCKGCAPTTPQSTTKPATERIVFLPADMLVRRRKSSLKK